MGGFRNRDRFGICQKLKIGDSTGLVYSLPALEEAGVGKISRLPICIRIILESLLRHHDEDRIVEEDISALANWEARKPTDREIPFIVSRIVLQDFTGVPLLVDLAAMRDAVRDLGGDPTEIEPLVPVDLVVDHSIQVDRFGTADAFVANLALEFQRNRERYQFLKWGQQAFETFRVIPPSMGIVHQINLEYLAEVVFAKKIANETVFYPDTVVGTDSHTTMINGLGVVGWGAGGIEAEAGMLGQPVYFLTPEVVGVNLFGTLREGVTATDLTLRVTELLRSENVVGKFVEFFGDGTANLPVADRATVANMTPENGGTIGYFPVDEKTLDYLRMSGRSEGKIEMVRDYFTAQGLFGSPRIGDIDYTRVLDLDLNTIRPSVAGPKRPQDRIEVPKLKQVFRDLLGNEVEQGGFGVSSERLEGRFPVFVKGGVEDTDDGNRTVSGVNIGHGSVLIAAITSCTNTSNPSVMIAAGLLAKKAVERGLKVQSFVKTSLAPGSRVVMEYLSETGLKDYLDNLGFNLVGYGCTTCIGNSGPLRPEIQSVLKEGEIVAASVLSGNRNFEARVHSAIKANFLMSPPLVVAYALAGRVDIDLTTEPLGVDKEGNPVYLREIWPSGEEVEEKISSGIRADMYRLKYSNMLNAGSEWESIHASHGTLYNWDMESTYIQKPPYFEALKKELSPIKELNCMRALAIVGDSVTTDHISPAGAIQRNSPSGKFLMDNGVEENEFNSFGSRRGNDRIMARGTFGNVRFKNLLAGGKEGGWTRLMPEGEIIPIFDAAKIYKERGTPLIVFAGCDYGMGSSRDWAAKGPMLLGVKAVVARSYERIHRSNLIGMGILPLEFIGNVSSCSLELDGSEEFSIVGLEDDLRPKDELTLVVKRCEGDLQKVRVIARIDTSIEVEYYRNGGILPYVLRAII
ncbi:MAG: Aconitate hydratase A [Candidatus Moanabacter tarae]|uniref:Aconitate hydratase n=1 Tax=Candidatus Moanibacter tarae TaxID=2200854 RepID=A0A2Z4AI09_9BACT|nr:MAG: Aconitate hydratase A [Candidatus Moanabacter tarae]|tara:strand:+ start:4118 stop:6865 length:2748 start_codon:yes stop_codon:yes gene_type:complete